MGARVAGAGEAAAARSLGAGRAGPGVFAVGCVAAALSGSTSVIWFVFLAGALWSPPGTRTSRARRLPAVSARERPGNAGGGRWCGVPVVGSAGVWCRVLRPAFMGRFLSAVPFVALVTLVLA